MRNQNLILCLGFAFSTAFAEPAPKMATEIPSGIAIPDEVETRLGTLKFFDGFPDKPTVEKIYDNLDFQRAVQAYLLALAPVNMAGLREGLLQVGPAAPAGKKNNWIQTLPGKGWNMLFRLYGPLEPWFDKTWRLSEIELMK